MKVTLIKREIVELDDADEEGARKFLISAVKEGLEIEEIDVDGMDVYGYCEGCGMPITDADDEAIIDRGGCWLCGQCAKEDGA